MRCTNVIDVEHTGAQITQIVDVAGRILLPASHSPTYRTLFALLAVTGMRISEALALRLGDVTDDGLVIRESKNKKSRLLPLHGTTCAALEPYVHWRRTLPWPTDLLFIESHGRRLSIRLARRKFSRILRHVGLSGPGQVRRPRLHDLRHTFAVRALERCPEPRHRVGEHVLALTTYLGHAHVSDTYWYLESTPHLLSSISEACESFVEEGDRL